MNKFAVLQSSDDEEESEEEASAKDEASENQDEDEDEDVSANQLLQNMERLTETYLKSLQL